MEICQSKVSSEMQELRSEKRLNQAASASFLSSIERMDNPVKDRMARGNSCPVRMERE